jgi:hypothetical protein
MSDRDSIIAALAVQWDLGPSVATMSPHRIYGKFPGIWAYAIPSPGRRVNQQPHLLDFESLFVLIYASVVAMDGKCHS